MGGNLIDYPGDKITTTADIITAKILFNSILSTKDTRFLGLDISNFYLKTPMSRYEYMKLLIKIIPKDIIQQYNLLDKVHKGFIYIEIRKGMYGLPQAGKIANDLLKKRLEPHGYILCKYTPGLWKHTSRPTMFTLVVNNFGVKITSENNTADIIKTLQNYYKITIDKEGKNYLGMDLELDYIKRTLEVSMKGYVQAACKRFNHKKTKQPVHGPYKYTPPSYGARIQHSEEDLSIPMTPQEKTTRTGSGCVPLLYKSSIQHNDACTQ